MEWFAASHSSRALRAVKLCRLPIGGATSGQGEICHARRRLAPFRVAGPTATDTDMP
jgi:hypothetical protein